jgi:hypothetical protein
MESGRSPFRTKKLKNEEQRTIVQGNPDSGSESGTWTAQRRRRTEHIGDSRILQRERTRSLPAHTLTPPAAERKTAKLNDDVAKALSAVFHIPARIWKGEPMSDDEARMITEVGLPALLMARKLEKLPPKFRQTILEQIEQAHEHEKLKRAVDPKKTDGS